MRYDEALIDQIQAANDIIDVISQIVPLKKAGQNFKGVCPFHQEKTPSFMVNPAKQIFHCFGCGVGGNVFAFLMKYENLNFPEALHQLADRAHITLPKMTYGKGDNSSDIETLYKIYQLAAEFYHALYLHPERGKTARNYFNQRGFSEDLAKEFQLGWAPLGEWKLLFEYLSKKGFSEPLLLRSGLIQKSPTKGTCYDMFRGRLLFPIRNLQGKIVGFGGRILGQEDGPKYLNSPENPIFHKRKELFGLYLAKKFISQDKPRILIVEGYMDFLGLYAAGFKMTAATLGTALGPDHVQVLKRFAEEAIVVYDGDKAGEAASLRGLEIFLEGGMNVRLIRMPEGYDPDDFVKEKGPEAFQALLDSAKTFFDYKLESALSRYNRKDPVGIVKLTDEFLETLVKIKQPILLDHYLRRLATELQIDETSLRNEMLKLQKKISDRERRFEPPKTVIQSTPVSSKEEMLLLGLMIEDADLRQEAFQDLQEIDFWDASAQQLFRLLAAWDSEEKNINWAQVLNHLEDEIWKKKLVAISALEWGPDERRKALQDCIKAIHKKRLEKRLGELRHSIAKAEREGDQIKVGTYVKQYQELLQQGK